MIFILYFYNIPKWNIIGSYVCVKSNTAQTYLSHSTKKTYSGRQLNSFTAQVKAKPFLINSEKVKILSHSEKQLMFFLTELIKTFLNQLQQYFCEQRVGCHGCTSDYQKPNPEPSLHLGASLWGCKILRFSLLLCIFLGERNRIIVYTQTNTLRISLSILLHVNLLVISQEFFLESSGILTLCKSSFSGGFAPRISCSFQMVGWKIFCEPCLFVLKHLAHEGFSTDRFLGPLFSLTAEKNSYSCFSL